MTIFLGIGLALVLGYFWLAGHWYGRAIVFIGLCAGVWLFASLASIGGWSGVGVFAALAVGCIGAWFASGIPQYLRRRRRNELPIYYGP